VSIGHDQPVAVAVPVVTVPQPSQRGAPAPDRGTPWLSLGPAARLVGVDPDTLRRWGDEGRIPVFVTPGGHRRFDRRSLDRLVASRRPAGQSAIAQLGATPTRLSRAYRRSYRGASDDGIRRRFTEDDRESLRGSGRELVASIVCYLDARDAPSRVEAEGRAEAAVDATARLLAVTGASTADAAELFLQQRRPFLSELANLASQRAMDPVTMAELYDAASALMDRLLLRLIAALAASPTAR
jgi:excisionase family DNA binding protein